LKTTKSTKITRMIYFFKYASALTVVKALKLKTDQESKNSVD